jgi:hypothetical protein
MEMRFRIASKIVSESSLMDENGGVLGVVCEIGTWSGIAGVANLDG